MMWEATESHYMMWVGKRRSRWGGVQRRCRELSARISCTRPRRSYNVMAFVLVLRMYVLRWFEDQSRSALAVRNGGKTTRATLGLLRAADLLHHLQESHLIAVEPLEVGLVDLVWFMSAFKYDPRSKFHCLAVHELTWQRRSCSWFGRGGRHCGGWECNKICKSFACERITSLWNKTSPCD